VFNWKGNVYSIFGSTLYKDGVSKGTVNATNGVYRFDSSLGATPRLQLGDGVKAYNYDDAAGLVLIIDGDFPTSFVKGWAFLDLTTYVMDASANIQGSGLSDTINWDPLNTLQAQIEPDGGKALAKQLTNVIAMKDWTTEVFYDAGNATASPLGRVAGAKANLGCISADSVQNIDGVLVWLAAARTATPSVVMMDNLKVTPISTEPIERLLTGLDFTTVFSWHLKVGGHKFYVLTIKEANLTLAIDLTERLWSQWTDVDGNYVPIVSSTFDSSRRPILQHETNGKLYYASMDYATDDGSLIQADIYTPNFDGGTRYSKYLPRIDFIADQHPGSLLRVRSTDDDYQTWNEFREVDLSTPNPGLRDEGSFSRRAYNFRHRCNTPLRVQAVELDLQLGTL